MSSEQETPHFSKSFVTLSEIKELHENAEVKVGALDDDPVFVFSDNILVETYIYIYRGLYLSDKIKNV